MQSCLFRWECCCRSYLKINWKKVIFVGGGISLVIEIIQLFEGRYAEIDDLILNTLGAFIGYNLYNCIVLFKSDKKKALCQSGILCMVILGTGSVIWLFCDHNMDAADGITAVTEEIESISYLHHGERILTDSNSHEFQLLCIQLNNCGGHIMDVQEIKDDKIENTNDYYVEIIFNQPVTISFQNQKDFIITNIDRILYNTNTNRIFWGNTSYQNSLDYTKLDESLKQYEDQIFAGYHQLNSLVVDKF